MRTLNNIGITVPGEFRWFCGETGTWVPERGGFPSYVDFISECKKHCVANHLPIGSLWEQTIQDQLCAGLDGEWCNEGGFPLPSSGGWGFNVQQVTEGTRMLAQKMISAKVRKIPQIEANYRASICMNCPMNQAPIGCSNCNSEALNVAANMVSGDTTTVYYAGLKSCKISGFSLKAKVNVPWDILRENISIAQLNGLPSICWLKYMPANASS